MRAEAGDRICVNSRTVAQAPRMGTVLEVRTGVMESIYRIRWDDGNESMFMPSAGVAVIVEPKSAEVDGTQEMSAAMPDLSMGCHIEVELAETDGMCRATATLMTSKGAFQGTGLARRHPEDPSVPLIGEELAIGRALIELSESLVHAAGEALAAHESRPIHLFD